MEAMYKGWKTKCVDLKVLHLRPTSAAYDFKEHAFKSGFEAYKNRMSFFLMFLRSIYKIFTKPYFLYSYYFIKGYITAYIEKPEFLIDEKLGRFINKFHYKRNLNLLK